MSASGGQQQQPSGLHSLFGDLQKCGLTGDHERGVRIANKILSEDAKNPKAYHCKIVSLIQLGKFELAIRDIDTANGLFAKAAAQLPPAERPGLSFLFEKAYSLYRLSRSEEAYEILKNMQAPESRTKELAAQVLYRLERYEEAYDVYLDLIKNLTDEFENERWTNLAAVMANMPRTTTTTARRLHEIDDDSVKTYELRYNRACVLLSNARLEDARRELETSEREGKRTLEDEGLSEEEIDVDLALIRAQLAYVYQAMGREDMALKIYNQILKQCASGAQGDSALIAVASSNSVAINREQNVFDSKKKIKTALTECEAAKLTAVQKMAIEYNNCLLTLHMNQRDACRKQLDAFLADHPEYASEVALIRASLLLREKKLDEAEELLGSAYSAAGRPKGGGGGGGGRPDATQNIPLALAFAQVLLQRGHVARACDVLKSLGGEASYRLGIRSALVSLYTSLADQESVLETLSECVAKFRREKRYDRLAVELMQETAKFCLENGRPREATELLEDLSGRDPKNLKLLSQLIAAYSQVDPDKAKEVSKKLPAIEDIIRGVDIEALEAASWSLGTKYDRKKGTGGEAAAAATAAADEVTAGKDLAGKGPVNKKNMKKKKKRSLPKNYDPNCDPDPERWLPKWQRSTFKKKKDRRGGGGGTKDAVGRGTQGSTADVEIPMPKKSNVQAPVVEGPRQQRPSVFKSKKKGKGKR